MKLRFRLSLLSLAILSVCAPTLGMAAAKQNAASSSSSNSSVSKYYSDFTSGGYPMTFAGTVPQTNAWKWSPNKPIMPTDYSQFMVWAEDINGGKSNEPLFGCWNDMFCVSGLLDTDLLFYDRKGNAFGPTASVAGVGVRPMFGPSQGAFFGSINNANLFFDLKFSNLARIHGNIAYVNGGVKEDSYAWHANSDVNNVYYSSASIKADELYAVFSSEHTYPVYLKVGRMYLDFGQYIPNGYGLPTITPSLTQLMTQVRTGGAQVGIAMQNGIYGSTTWSMANQSLLAINRGTPNRNYSAKLGIMRQYEDAYFNVNASYLWDVRDADYFNGILYVGNVEIASSIDNYNGPFSMRRQHAYAVHGDGKYKQWGAGVEGAAVTGALNPDGNSNLWTAGANVNYSFPTVGHDSSFDLSYQIARHAAIINGTTTLVAPPYTGFPIGPLSNEFPKNRIQLTYLVKIVKHINIGVQLVRDKDFAPSAGTNYTSHFGIFRIDLEV